MDKKTEGQEVTTVRGAGMTIARIKEDTTTGVETLTYIHTDHLGSTSTATDTSGAVLWREHHSPFGEALNPQTENDNLAAFTGHIRDVDTGLTYMQARYYDPVGARFLSIDPVTFANDGRTGMFNRYGYANNDPVNMIDLDGQAWGLASKAFKVVKNGGDLAATFAGAAADIKTIASGNATLKTRLLATASLGSEIFSPVSARDAKAIADGAKRTVRNAQNAKDGKSFQTNVGNENNLTPNTTKFSTSEGNTIPDFMEGPDVSDAKNVKNLSNTKQMRAQRKLAEDGGGTHTVYVNADKNPHVTGPMNKSTTEIIRCNCDGTIC